MASMAMVSCLDFSPEAQMNDDSVWSKANNFQLFANQFYGYTHDIQSGASYQYAVSDGPHSDTRSDLIAGANVNVYSQGTNTIPQSDGNYTTLYRQIYYTNLLLKKAASFDNKEAIKVPVAEVHMSDISKREPFRINSVISEVCVGTVKGLGKDSYLRGIDLISEC